MSLANVLPAGTVTTTKLADDAVTPAKSALFNYQTDNSDTIASTTNGAVKFQVGWGQVVGNGAANLTQTVTFPEAFTTVLGAGVWLLDAKLTTAATSVTDLTTQAFAAGGGTTAAGDITTTTFLAQISRDAGTFSNTVYYGYSWVAWGIV